MREPPLVPLPVTPAADAQNDQQTEFDFPTPKPDQYEFDEESPFNIQDWEKRPTETAAKLKRFYERNRFLPPPPSAMASEQLRVLNQYKLEGPIQKETFNRCTSLLSSIFDGKTSFVSLFREGRQIITAAAGTRAQEMLSLDMGNECAICSHTVLRQEPQRVEINDVNWSSKTVHRI